ncbi:MAG: RDD family protein [Candidatus Tenebribacter davisii]|nr:RDD family protein [Candidatus Tenebribacter davisii]
MKDFKYVGFWQRVLSYLIDDVILYVITYSIVSIFYDNLIVKIYQVVHPIYLLVFGYLMVAFCTILFWKFAGATPGKLIIRAKIVDAQSGSIPNFGKLIIRYFFYPISLIIPSLGCIWVGIDSRKQSWHDKMAGTVVVRKNRIKKKKEIEPNVIPENIDPLFPTSPSIKDKKKWKWGKYLLILTTICIISFLYFIHFSDETLIPKAKEWLYEPEFVESNPEDNGYYHLIGLFVPEGQSSSDLGYNVVKTNNEYVFDYSKNINLTDYREDPPNADFGVDSGEMVNIFNSESFIQYCQDNEKKITQTFKQFSYIEKRMNTISKAKYFKNTTSPSFVSKILILMDFVQYNLLKNSYLTTLYINGSKSKALTILEDDMKFIRELSEKADFLILKLITPFLLERDLKTFNHLLDYENIDLSYLQKSIQSIKPISISERDMEKVAKRQFAFEVNLNLFMYNLTTKQKDFVCKNNHFTKNVVRSSRSILFKPHKTINQHYLIKKYLVDISRVTGKEFMQLDKNPYIFQPSILDFVNNYIASMIMLKVADVLNNKFVATFHNVDAYINMLKLKVMIIDQNIAKINIPDFLESHKDSLYNPYTEESFKWDTERSMLYFEGPYESDNNMKELKIN